MVKDKYTCPRCDYMTHDKSCMRRHLYNKQKPCPGSKNTIELTEEIKEHILSNRVYIIPREVPITHNINYYNTMNNFIAGLDPLDKLNKYFEKRNVHVVPLDMQIEREYRRRNNNMIAMKGTFEVSSKDIYEAIDNVTRCTKDDFSDYNIVYDSKLSKIMVRDSDSWKDMSISKGVVFVVEKLKEYHLDNYELYLIRKLESGGLDGRQTAACLELLKDYYAFLCCFDLEPHVRTTINPIIDGKNGEEIEEKYWKLYKDVFESVSLSKQRKMRGDILEMIKTNGKQNIKDLNKLLTSIIDIDKDFRQFLLN